MDDLEKEGTVILTTPIGEGPGTKPTDKRLDACIILLHPPGADIGRKTVLSETSYVIGRDSSCDLALGRDSVSRRHAIIRQVTSGDWQVEDLDSTNGSFVNEQRVKEQPLFDGDQLRIGDVIFKFLTGANIESAYHEEIFRMTIIDGLTGVHNKRYFLDFIDREVASAKRHGHPLSLVMLDLDHFKQVNDTRGHLCGDEVLKQMAGRIKSRIRREDLFARFGGEEFAAVLGNTSLTGALHFAEAVRYLIGTQPFEFEDESFTVTVSVGVACLTPDQDIGVDDLVKAADDNLYRAKHDGRNQVFPPVTDPSRR